MEGVTHAQVRTNGVDLHVASAGEGPVVLLAHGFPEVWGSWRHQIEALAGAGYRVLAPDQRGYGGSDRPGHVDDYDVVHLGDDLLGLLDAEGVERAVVVGHDWGAIVAWHLAQRAPERLAGVAALSVPFVPRPPVPPTQVWRHRYGTRFFYILYFQEEGRADAELDADPELVLRRMYWSVSGDAGPEGYRPEGVTRYVDALTEPPGGALPPWMPPEELAAAVTAFTASGFTGPLRWYRNFDRNWEITEPIAKRQVEIPALFVAGTSDPVLRMMPVGAMYDWVPGLTDSVMIEGAGHWVQQERPAEANAALLRFLAGLDVG